MLRRQVAAVIYEAYTVRRKAAPRVLLEFAMDLHRTFPEPVPEPARFRAAAPLPASGQPVISVADAAGAAGVSTRYIRRMVSRGDIEVMPRGSANARYRVLADSFALWLSDRQHRVERDVQAA